MNRLYRFLCCAAFAVAPASFAQCLTFPANLIPLTAVSYVTAANSSGDQLVVGALTGGLNTISQLPLPDYTNELYCDPPVQLASPQLAPGQYYPNVYVPSAAERSGNFSAFAGLLVNPANNQPFPGGIIPASLLGQVYAFRIGPAQGTQGVRSWSATGSVPWAANFQAATILPSGKVLVAVNQSAAVYDPATGQFTIVGPMAAAHGGDLTASLLNDGRVLIVGGSVDPTASEIYDPTTGRFTLTGKPTQPHGAYHTATVLNDGRVLIVGGKTTPGFFSFFSIPPPTAGYVASGADLYDPKTGSFTAASPMGINRSLHTASLLLDGRVLLAGGYPSNALQATNAAELFDPATSRFTATGFMGTGRNSGFGLTLPNGKVLFSGDYTYSAELFDPLTGTFSFTGSPATSSQTSRAALLSNGQVLASGGLLPSIAASTGAYLYNPGTGTFSGTAPMNSPRYANTSTLLLDGRVLVTGGANGCCGAPYLTTNTAEIYTPTVQGLVTSQSGLTFRAAQGTTTVAQQALAVLSPSDDIPWAVSVKTYSGGNWLSASPSSSESKPGAPPVTLTVSVDPTGLAPQDYYGAVTLTPTDQKHPPITVAIVFSIVPAGSAAPLQVAPAGLVFLTTVGGSPAPQPFKVTNFTNSAVSFTATSSSTFFTFSPSAGTITTAIPGVITVTPSASKLTAGVYRGSIKLAFSDSSTQTVDVLLVISPAPSGSITERGATALCTPAKLLPILTSVASGSTSPIAWPTPVLVQVVDDCGNPINSGSVTASFTNGDPPISLLSIGSATWSGTWVPVHASSGTTVRVDARLLQPALSGTVQVPVQVAANPKVPVVASGGVLSSGDYSSPPAAGLLVAIFGSALADGSLGFSQVPLPTQLGSTQVLLGGVALPMVYVSENQVNVLVPFESTLNAPLPLLVTRANAISVPVTVAVFDAEPAILATAGNGRGQGLIYVATSATQTLADANAPATAGDTLVMYCLGLGGVTPAVKTGDASPSSPLASVAAPVTVTIGGQSAKPFFAGLTPGYVGLYQVNVVVPAGIAPGAQVPVSVSVGAKSSPAAITMAVK